MKEYKLRVEFTPKPIVNENFYGANTEKTIIEKIHVAERDERDKERLAPCGVYCKFVTKRDETIFINVDRFYLPELNNDWSSCQFIIDELAFELNVKFEDDKLVLAQLYEWGNLEDFFDGRPEDIVYSEEYN